MKDETHAARMERLLRTLPPAVRGMGCGDPDDAQYAHASDVVLWAISEIDRLRDERRWIPVGERLPELGVDVLVCGKDLYADIGWRHKWCLDDGRIVWSVGDGENGGDTFGLTERVTHWMPLPAPPKGGEVEE